jgi:alkylation response protein AidB-like acyl-CoA dehydrogenase
MSNKEETKGHQDDHEHVIDTTGMTKGKADALAMAEASRDIHWAYPTFAGALFMGKLPWKLIHPFPQLDSDRSDEGEAFLERLETFLREHVDPDEIDRVGEIPDEVIRGLAEMGAFGIKTPKEYGGLGLSQQYYSRAAMLLGSYCANSAALLSAHQSIGVPQPLLQFGTEDQKQRFLTRTARGEISAFALTEEGVGSDPARMETTAEPSPCGKFFILNGRKLWCTNGTVAGLLVVMAKTPPKIRKGKEINQISAFVVDADAPGVEVVYRCRFMGLKSLYNAIIDFKDVKVPVENIIAGEGKGLRVALTTLNTGRLTLPANCVGAIRACLKMARQWSNEREQWGSTIGKHGAIADKIARIASTLFALESMTTLTAALVDRKQTDIRVEAAMAKMFGTEEAWDITYETMQIIGGRGYETQESLKGRGETPYPIERVMRDMRINTIFEGSSEIMRLFLAREAMDPHLKISGEAVNTRLPMGRRLKAAFKALGFYVFWYPKQWLPFGAPSTSDLEPALAKQVRYVARTSRKLARRMYHTMLKFGPKLEREQILVGRFVEIGTELFAIAASCARAQQLINQGTDKNEVLGLVDFFCRESHIRIADLFRGVRHNNDRVGYNLAQGILDRDVSWLYDDMVRKELRKEEPAEHEMATN